MTANPAGAPPLDTWFDEHDTWTLTTQPSSLAHYAMWPPKLAERLILSMCPLEVCAQCGEPRRRIETRNYVADDGGGASGKHRDAKEPDGIRSTAMHSIRLAVAHNQLGWSDCGHDAYAPGVVLDPFAGTGTTLAVADYHGRDAIGIDLDARNFDIYPARVREVERALNPTYTEQTVGQIGLFEVSA